MKKIEEIKPVKIRKNDVVLVTSGNYRGKKGKVLKVYPREMRLIVEGVNFIKKHTRKTGRGQGQQGGIQEREAPINISNVILVCPKCGSPTRVGKYIAEDKSRARLCKKCNEMIDV